MTRRTLALALLAGCATKDEAVVVGDTDTAADTDVTQDTDGGGQGRPDVIPCSDATSTLGLDEASALGFSAQDVLTAAAATTTATGAYTPEEGGSTTQVTITLASDGDPVFHDREEIVDTDVDTDPVSDGPPLGLPSGGACGDQLEIPVVVHLTTDDGAFDETVSTALLLDALDTFSVSGDLDWQHLGGTFTIDGIDPADWDTVSLDFGAMWAGDALSGQVNVQASRQATPDVGEGYTGPVLRWPTD